MYAVASHATRGLDQARRHAAADRPRPGGRRPWPTSPRDVGARPRRPSAAGGVVLVGERLATVPGALRAAADLAAATGARLAWVPASGGGARCARGRRARRRCCPVAARSPTPPRAPRSPRPGTSTSCRPPRPVTPPASSRPPRPATSTPSSSVASTRPTSATRPPPRALEQAVRRLARAARVAGHRRRRRRAARRVAVPRSPAPTSTGRAASARFEAALASNAVSDHRALDMLAGEMGVFLETRTQREIHAQFEALGPWAGARADAAPPTASAPPPRPDGHRRLRPVHLGHAARRRPHAGRRAVPRRHRAARRRPPVRGLGRRPRRRRRRRRHRDRRRRGSVTLPAVVTEGMVDGVVWLPTNARGLLDPHGPRHRCRCAASHVTKGGAA